LILELSYRDSKKCIVIQAADFIAGTVRRNMMFQDSCLFFLDYKIFLP